MDGNLSDYKLIPTPTPAMSFGDAYYLSSHISYKDINNVSYMCRVNDEKHNFDVIFSDPKISAQKMYTMGDPYPYRCAISLDNRTYIEFCNRTVRLRNSNTKMFRYIASNYDIIAAIDSYSDKLYVFLLDLDKYRVIKSILVDSNVNFVIVESRRVIYKKNDGTIYFFETLAPRDIYRGRFTPTRRGLTSTPFKLDDVIDIWPDKYTGRTYILVKTPNNGDRFYNIGGIYYNMIHIREDSLRVICDHGCYQILYDPK